MRIFIVRHLDESFFSAGITPQGFYNQHSPLTLFRKVEVLTIIYSIALQRQVFVIHFRGGVQYFLQLWLRCVAVEATLDGNENSRPRVAHIQTFSLLSNHANSSFQLDAFVEYWVVIEIGSLERSALPDKLSSWTEQWRAGGAQPSPWGPLCFIWSKSTVCLCISHRILRS